MNYKKRIHDLEQYLSDRERVYDTLGDDYRALKSELAVMKNPASNWRVAQYAALSSYINARKSGQCSKQYVADCRRVGLSMMQENRRYFRALGVFPVKHFCQDCRQVSRAPFLIGPMVVRPACRNDDCAMQWWNKPQFNGDIFEALKTIAKIDQTVRGK